MSSAVERKCPLFETDPVVGRSGGRRDSTKSDVPDLVCWAWHDPSLKSLLLAGLPRPAEEKIEEGPARRPSFARTVSRLVEAGLATHASVTPGRERVKLNEQGRRVAWLLRQHEADAEVEGMFERLALGPESLFLDVGCGSGPALVRAASSPLRLAVGTDRDRQALQAAKRLLNAVGAPARLVQADIVGLPFKDGVFTHVACRLVLPYVAQRRAAFEVSRILSPKGRVFLQLHSCRFYLRQLRRELGQWKRLLLNGFCLVNGLLFHLTGWQLAVPTREGSYRELCHTEAGITRLLARNGLAVRWMDKSRLFQVLGAKLGG